MPNFINYTHPANNATNSTPTVYFSNNKNVTGQTCIATSNISTINLNTNRTSYELVTQERLGVCLYKAINEMDKEQCAKILYALFNKMTSDEKREKVNTLLKLYNNDYYKVVKQIFDI